MIEYGGKRYDTDWYEIDPMGNRLSGEKDWAANADWAGNTGGQNPYTNAPGSSDYDKSGLIPGNEKGSTLPAGPAPGGWRDDARIQAYLNSFQVPKATAAPSVGGAPGVPAPAAPKAAASPLVPRTAAREGDSDDDGTSDAALEAARRGLANVYRQFLGRDPQPGEVDSWLSGAYGYGSGVQDYDKFVTAIMNSPEALAHNAQGQTPTAPPGTPGAPATPTAPPAGPGVYQDINWWAQHGVAAGEIFDTMTGQLKPGWARTAKGYERTGGAPAGPPGGPQGGDIQAWVMSQLRGASSPQALAALESLLNQRGIKLQKDSAGNVRGRLYLPDGSTVDVVSQWGQPWTWINRGTGGGAGGSGGSGGAGSPIAPTFDDPWTKLLEQLLGGRIGSLGQPVFDPNRAAYEQALKDRAAALGQAEQPYTQLLDYLQKRFTDLQGPGYTGAENEVIRTGALDPIEQDRAAAKKRVIERLSARGLTPDSGIYQQALLEVDKAFDGMRGTTQTALTTNDLNRREDRASRAQTIGAQLVDIPEGRKREQLDVFSALEMLSNAARQEEDARAREAIGYAGAGSDLGPQRLQLAMQAAGMGGNPSSMFDSLLQMAGLNQNSALFANQNQKSLWSGLGSIAAILANSGRR